MSKSSHSFTFGQHAYLAGEACNPTKSSAFCSLMVKYGYRDNYDRLIENNELSFLIEYTLFFNGWMDAREAAKAEVKS